MVKLCSVTASAFHFFGEVCWVQPQRFKSSFFQHQFLQHWGMHCMPMRTMQEWLFITKCQCKQCGIFSEIGLIGSKETKQNKEKRFFTFSCLNWGLNLSVLSALSYHLNHHTSCQVHKFIKTIFRRFKNFLEKIGIHSQKSKKKVL